MILYKVNLLKCYIFPMIIKAFFSKHIILMYRPPNSSLAQFYEQLDNILDKCDSKLDFVVAGDFNIDCSTKSLNSRKLINLFNSHDFKLNNYDTTHNTIHSSSTIDLIFSNHSDRLEIDNIKTIPIDFSDHNLILFRSNKVVRVKKIETIQYQLINSKTNGDFAHWFYNLDFTQLSFDSFLIKVNYSIENKYPIKL